MNELTRGRFRCCTSTWTPHADVPPTAVALRGHARGDPTWGARSTREADSPSGAAYRDVEGIAWVTSLTNVVDFHRAWGGIEVGRLIGRGELPRTEADARRLEARVMAEDRLVGSLVSEDGTAAAILLRFGARGGGQAPAEYETATRARRDHADQAYARVKVSFRPVRTPARPLKDH